ncbi:tetratricopeptide repeat protein [Streptomyces sp. NPDC005438]|uniref:tetratricopeptide repeat protein n=1 Tax=Streptomyces sp. NPDC005438 TaxID=3156880 RepID=UPI0033B57867
MDTLRNAPTTAPLTGAHGREDLAERYQRALLFFESGDHITASRLLAEVVRAAPENLSVRLLLARSLYHSAQLRRAERELREVLARDPAEAYAHLLLGRTLERLSRPTEAGPHRRLAEAMGVPG